MYTSKPNDKPKVTTEVTADKKIAALESQIAKLTEQVSRLYNALERDRKATRKNANDVSTLFDAVRRGNK